MGSDTKQDEGFQIAADINKLQDWKYWDIEND